MSFEIYKTILIGASTILTIQGFIAIWQMIYGWLDREKLARRQMPREIKPPQTQFSLIIPCRHEEKVIYDTLCQLLKQTYPRDMYEILVPMSADDSETIDEVKRVISNNPGFNINILLFSDGPINKPHGLNVALKEARGDFIAVFDAEDGVYPCLLDFVNTTIVLEGRKIIQTGVSLTNWNGNWFSLNAALEYYFWFNSRLHWFADNKVITLAGVGIFLPKEILDDLGGWDERFLTEDAKLGIDLSIEDYNFRILCEEEYSTYEEVPEGLGSFIKQRTRWVQGFIQIAIDGNWRNLPFKKQLYLLSLVLFPFFQFFLSIWTAYSIFFAPKLPMSLVMISVIPMGILFFQLSIQYSQMVEMMILKKQHKLIPYATLIFLISFIPYQIIMVIAAIRAIVRQLTGKLSWEKTNHVNSHRKFVKAFYA